MLANDTKLLYIHEKMVGFTHIPSPKEKRLIDGLVLFGCLTSNNSCSLMRRKEKAT